MKKKLLQKAVHWFISGTDEYGAIEFDSNYPEEIDVRWTDKSILVVTDKGTEETADAVIHADKVLRVGDYLLLGVLDNLDSSMEPSSNGARRIIAIKKVYGTRGRKYTFKAFLKVGTLAR